MINNRYNNKLKRKKNKQSIFLLIFLIILTAIIFFNDMGIIKYYQIKEQNKILKLDIEKIISKNDSINIIIDRLNNDYDYIEKIAREKFYMAKKGEKIFRIQKK